MGERRVRVSVAGMARPRQWGRNPVQRRGRRGEDIAVRRLRWRGFRILARNFRVRGGELDIVASRGGTLHVVEVKTRSVRSRAPPAAVAVGRVKRRRMVRATRAFVAGRGARLGFDRVVFTIVEVTLGRWWSRVRFIEDAFRAEDGCG